MIDLYFYFNLVFRKGFLNKKKRFIYIIFVNKEKIYFFVLLIDSYFMKYKVVLF